jgi:predicted nucleic acid-binding protein
MACFERARRVGAPWFAWSCGAAPAERERKVLREFERLVPELAITDEVWSEACDLARRCRGAGVSVPATDLLIAACARHHGAELEQADGYFDAIARVSWRAADK